MKHVAAGVFLVYFFFIFYFSDVGSLGKWDGMALGQRKSVQEYECE
jgi:hypothetical protein